MNPIHADILQDAIRRLDTLKLKYAIQLEDGKIVGELEIAPIKEVKVKAESDRNPYSIKELRDLIEPQLKLIETGDSAIIDTLHYDPFYFARTLSTCCHEIFGAGRYKTKRYEASIFVTHLDKSKNIDVFMEWDS